MASRRAAAYWFRSRIQVGFSTWYASLETHRSTRIRRGFGRSWYRTSSCFSVRRNASWRGAFFNDFANVAASAVVFSEDVEDEENEAPFAASFLVVVVVVLVLLLLVLLLLLLLLILLLLLAILLLSLRLASPPSSAASLRK